MSGLFISFEGGEGAGKTTQINLLYDYLQTKKNNVLLTKEPGGSIICNKIRKLILSKKEEEKLAPLAELFLYLADRAHHVAKVIRPALDANKIVICDRYTDSTLVYQGYGRGLNMEQLESWNILATENLQPDITFVFDIEPTIGLTRIKTQRGLDGLDRMESEALEFHKRIRNGYLALLDKFPQRIKIIDASKSIDEIHNIIKQYIP